MKRIFLLIALLSGQCFAQGVWYSSNVTTVSRNVPAGASAPVLTLPNAIVTVCASPAAGSPCTNTVPIYNDQAMTSAMANPLTADSQGRFGFWVAAGVYSYSVQNPDGTVVGTYPLSLDSPVGPQGPGGIGCGTGNCVVTGSPLSQDITVLNNVQNASLFSGVDIGAKINAAFASCISSSGTSCKVTLPPNTKYNYATQIQIPGESTDGGGFIAAIMNLDCQGSALTWTGTGDAIQVLAQNGNTPTGSIKNCTIINGAGNTASVDGIHQFSRIAMEYDSDSIYGFTNPSGSGIHFDNTATAWGGYSERTLMYRVTTWNDTKGIRYQGSDGGTSSFAYNTIIAGECTISDGQTCVSVEGTGGFQSADVYSAYIDLKGNATFSTTAGNVFQLTGGADIRGATINANVESMGPVHGYFYNVDSSSLINAVGERFAPSFSDLNASTSDAIALPQLNSPFALQAGPFVLGNQQANNSKLIWDNRSLRYGMVVGLPNAFQLFSRVTTNPSDPEVDATPSSGNQQVNVLYSSPTGNGFGPGYGFNSVTGGTKQPAHAIETERDFAIVAPSIGIGSGVSWVKNIDSGGNGVDYFEGGFAAGQPGFHVIQKMYDYGTTSVDSGMERWSGGGRIHYLIPLHTPGSSSDLCTTGEISNDASYMYVCTATNTWKRAALATF